ncbi:hypothetical protein [Lactobacillus bombicola]|uniref:hypothetical protein n=1 Tax=Lactobacillus bombicola TaxID=1505723 RepID=UPI000E591FB0|nr:hypothetical protein [Lactobacillus bombicola]RHW48710.1 hypothetical protein DS833_07635 [Lactobacillus bombicola]
MGKKHSILVYHVNSQENITSVINSYKDNAGKLYFSNEDGFWAGSGMYFWDNKGNANYWKMRTHNEFMLSANLNIDENCILDFTDQDVLEQYEKLWPLIAEKFHVSNNSTPGKKINTICKIIPNIKIVKVSGYYPNIDERPFISGGKKKSSDPHMTIKTKTIFCVKCFDVLDNVREVI